MSLEADLLQLANAKARLKEEGDIVAELEKKLVDGMIAANQTSISVKKGELKGTLVEASRVVTDNDKLLKSLTPAQRKKVTVEVIDKAKLEAAISMNIVDPQTVAAASEERFNRPYVRITGSPVNILPDDVLVGVKPRKRTVRIPTP